MRDKVLMAKEYGQWKITDSLNEGGQAHIFLVQQKDSRKIGVLKRLKNLKRLNRFKSELEVIQSLDETFFPKIYDCDLNCDTPYFVMEYVESGCLTEELVRAWSLKQKIRFYIHLIHAINCAHEREIIHRDLKPQNILVDSDLLPKVTDFGICFLDDDGERQTFTDEAVGSFRFMAPEMEDGRTEKVGRQTDVYSLGKIGYWLFAGKIYNRERHREPQFDLTKNNPSSWHYYLNDFLDRATDPNSDSRISSTSLLLEEFDLVRRSIEEKVRYLDLNIEQKCSFCGIGTYQLTVDTLNLENSSGTKLYNFGINPVGSPQWLIMCCDACGNIQFFRKDLCSNWRWPKS